MGKGKNSVRRQLSEFLVDHGGAPVTEALWAEIRECFPSTSSGYLRRLLRDSGAPLVPMVEGIRQDSFDELGRTLLALEREYAAADEEDRRGVCRRLVIEAKDHARFAARRKSTPAEKRVIKEEMIQWMLVWLDNPEMFPTWLRLRRRRVEFPAPTADKEEG